ncbi:protein phosphatase 2C domain-containing protein [Streptomyces litchfieldiae]|uniref:Protein phosphatase 2C domain-containing protein n=1 Tax=Streptomyces litchfieldiae TaxID=3075543 RepID=A0ABU2MJ21_9ACTN|nr:protein phosphatase 2C domain-containing protein [Streptomyces sp. DSM 44938]MDT0341602.1 protein phosphatase 2C domain-containing protein [Streptomyces sp. DSM 44938]
MRIQITTEPGTPGLPNDDFAATAVPAGGSGGALVLLDGVTAPAGERGCRHGVPWFAARLGGALLELCASRRGDSLTACLAEAISRTADAHRGTCDLSHPRTPQATVVCARWDDASVDYLVLCDSVLLIEEPDGVVMPVLDTRLDDLRPGARLLAPEDPGAFIEALRNAEGGFFTAAADPAVATRAVTGSAPAGAVRSLAAVTDGLGRWVEVFGLGGWPELFALLAKEGAEEAIRQVRAAEAADPAGTAFPRGKAHDDASAILVTP